MICPLPAGEGASTVRLDDYGDVAPMLAAFSQQSDAHGAPAPDCAVSATGSAEWSVPRIATGHVLCYPSGGDSYIVWTYDSGSGVGILATASRDDVLWHRLYDWWRAFHPLVAY